jgi:ADP-ribose pyrophosphatase YjhB (NUDIX family)
MRSAYVKAVDINGNYHDVSRDEVQWRIHAYGIVVVDNKILLSPQHGDSRYDLPGGKVEIDESVETGLKREIKEETGIDVHVIKQVAVRDIIFKVTFREPQDVWHSVMVYYVCEKIGGTTADMQLDEYEREYAGEAVWLDLDRLDDISLASSYDWRQVVQEYLRVN